MSGNKDLEGLGACQASPATACSPSGSSPVPGLAADALRPTGAAILLHYPKYLDNLGMIARSAACYGASAVWFTGDRISFDVERLPRELRMREYRHTKPRRVFNFRRALESCPATPVAVEIVAGAEALPNFDHPERALYVFGPEDGSLPPEVLKLCHRFVVIPTEHCLSLPVAVSTVLYDRQAKAEGR